MPVVTEFVARETQGCHIGRVDYMPVIAEFVARETRMGATVKGILSIRLTGNNSSGDAKSCVSTGRTPPLSLMGNGMVYTLANSRYSTPHILRNRNKTCMASGRSTDKT